MEVKVKNHDDVVRDGRSGAVIASDMSELLKYRKRKADLLRERDRDNTIAGLKAEVNDLKAIIAEMRELLTK